MRLNFFQIHSKNDKIQKKLAGGIRQTKDGTLEAIAIDKDLQEDARKITFNSQSRYQFNTTDSLNLSHYDKGGVYFQMRKDDSSHQLKISIEKISVDMTSLVHSMQIGKWTDVYIPFHCFKNKELDMRSLKKVFTLEKKEGSVSMANIKLLKNSQGDGFCE